MFVDESINVLDGRLDPDFTMGSPYLRELRFAMGFHQVGNDYGAVVPVPQYCSGMVSRK
jgi:hypothetical protein